MNKSTGQKIGYLEPFYLEGLKKDIDIEHNQWHLKSLNGKTLLKLLEVNILFISMLREGQYLFKTWILIDGALDTKSFLYHVWKIELVGLIVGKFDRFAVIPSVLR